MAPSALPQESPCVLEAALSISETMNFVGMSFSSLIYSLYSVFWYVSPNVVKHYNLTTFSLSFYGNKSDGLTHLYAFRVKFSLYFYDNLIAIRNIPMVAVSTIISKVSKNDFRLYSKCAQK